MFLVGKYSPVERRPKPLYAVLLTVLPASFLGVAASVVLTCIQPDPASGQRLSIAR